MAVFVLVISSALAANYDLTTTGSSATVNGAIFQQYGTGGGTGVIDSFLRVQNDGTEKGYNTNGALEFDTKGGGFTKSIKLSAVPQVNIGGTLYREFVLDTNESGGGNIYLDLEELQVFTAASGNLTGYVATPPGIGGGTSLIWRLDDGTNNTVIMRQFASGSGQTD